MEEDQEQEEQTADTNDEDNEDIVERKDSWSSMGLRREEYEVDDQSAPKDADIHLVADLDDISGIEIIRHNSKTIPTTPV